MSGLPVCECARKNSSQAVLASKYQALVFPVTNMALHKPQPEAILADNVYHCFDYYSHNYCQTTGRDSMCDSFNKRTDLTQQEANVNKDMYLQWPLRVKTQQHFSCWVLTFRATIYSN